MGLVSQRISLERLESLEAAKGEKERIRTKIKADFESAQAVDGRP